MPTVPQRLSAPCARTQALSAPLPTMREAVAQRLGASAPSPLAPGVAPETSALHDERARLAAAVHGGAEVRVWLEGTRWSVGACPEGPQPPAYRVMALHPVAGAPNDVEIEFAAADEPYRWGRVDRTITLRAPGRHRFWAALLKEAGVARHPHFLAP